MADDRAKLEDLVIRFTDAFNRDDLDGVMSFMADDAIYEEFNGTINRGAATIRAAFVPQFRGDFGTLRFVTEDLFVDAGTISIDGRPVVLDSPADAIRAGIGMVFQSFMLIPAFSVKTTACGALRSSQTPNSVEPV